MQAGGGADEETFATGSRRPWPVAPPSVVTFSTQFKGGGVLEPLAEYHRRADAGAMVDYAFHQIITDPTEAVHPRRAAGRWWPAACAASRCS